MGKEDSVEPEKPGVEHLYTLVYARPAIVDIGPFEMISGVAHS